MQSMARKGRLLHELLRSAAERDPAQPVFIRNAQQTSYGQLERSSGRLAASLRELGIERGDRVALAIDGDVDYLVAYYGIARAGAVVVPLCSDTRTKPLVYALQHSEAKAVILDASNLRYLRSQAPTLPALRWVIRRGAGALESPGHLECVEFEELLSQREEAHEGGGSDSDLLSITYTSGTTGRPKGVMLSHRNLVANVQSIVGYLGLRPPDRVAMVLPFYYVYGNSVLHTHVCAGATIVHAGTLTFPAQVLKNIAEQRCTGFSGVPATFARLLTVSDIESYALGSLRYVTQAGAAMSPALLQRLRAALPQASVFVMYGQTEAAARLACLLPEDLDRKLGSAGRAIPGVTLEIVDAQGRTLPSGEAGEIVASGDNIMLGYWRDPDATASTLRNARLHTGDLGRMDDEGFLFISGRSSEMIKSGGHRIAPQEIESAIQSVPGVRDCAVVGVPDPLLGQTIAAFIVPDPGAEIDRAAVLRACAAELPRFKLPEHVLLVPDLPRTDSSKIRRGALLDWFNEHAPKQTQKQR